MKNEPVVPYGYTESKRLLAMAILRNKAIPSSIVRRLLGGISYARLRQLVKRLGKPLGRIHGQMAYDAYQVRNLFEELCADPRSRLYEIHAEAMTKDEKEFREYLVKENQLVHEAKVRALGN